MDDEATCPGVGAASSRWANAHTTSGYSLQNKSAHRNIRLPYVIVLDRNPAHLCLFTPPVSGPLPERPGSSQDSSRLKYMEYARYIKHTENINLSKNRNIWTTRGVRGPLPHVEHERLHRVAIKRTEITKYWQGRLQLWFLRRDQLGSGEGRLHFLQKSRSVISL